MDAILVDVQERLKRIEDFILNPPAQNEIMDVEEVVSLTGLKKQTIYQLKYDGKIPYFKFGKRLLRFRRSEILNWMQNNA